MKKGKPRFQKDEFVFVDGQVRQIRTEPYYTGFTWMYSFLDDDQGSLGEMYLQKIDQEKYIAATKKYRVAKCYDETHQDKDCCQIEKWTQLKSESPQEGYVPVEFHRPENSAKIIAHEWIEKEIHEALCSIRVSWYYESPIKVERRREIDRWYNSRTAAERRMIDDILEDLRYSKDMDCAEREAGESL